MRLQRAVSACQYSWSIWEATCEKRPYGRQHATGKFGSRAQWSRYWVVSWICRTMHGACRMIVAWWWTEPQTRTNFQKTSSAQHGETLEGYGRLEVRSRHKARDEWHEKNDKSSRCRTNTYIDVWHLKLYILEHTCIYLCKQIVGLSIWILWPSFVLGQVLRISCKTFQTLSLVSFQLISGGAWPFH